MVKKMIFCAIPYYIVRYFASSDTPLRHCEPFRAR